MITSKSSDTACPKGALVASGSITAVLGSPTDPSTAAGTIQCDPLCDVWNGGQGNGVLLRRHLGSARLRSGAITTGAVGPYPGTYKQVGKNLVIDTRSRISGLPGGVCRLASV